jgi:ACS family tartrate transporter-like MFS transporter
VLNIGLLAFALVADDLRPSTRAVGSAAVNTIAQIGSFVGPALWGLAADRTGTLQFGPSVIPLVMLVAAGIVLAMRRRAMGIAIAATTGDA